MWLTKGIFSERNAQNILSLTCASGWTRNADNCRCYKFVTTSRSWTEASKDCQEIAPVNRFGPPVTARHLAAPQNKKENDFICDLTRGKVAWIGGFKFADGNWGWTDGQKWGAFINWRKPNEPNNRLGIENSIGINWGSRGLWNDFPYQNRWPYVCQYLDLQSECIKRKSNS